MDHRGNSLSCLLFDAFLDPRVHVRPLFHLGMPLWSMKVFDNPSWLAGSGAFYLHSRCSSSLEYLPRSFKARLSLFGAMHSSEIDFNRLHRWCDFFWNQLVSFSPGVYDYSNIPLDIEIVHHIIMSSERHYSAYRRFHKNSYSRLLSTVLTRPKVLLCFELSCHFFSFLRLLHKNRATKTTTLPC